MIFLDASFIISYFLKKHEDHKRTAELWEKYEDKERIISNLIIAEVSNVLHSRLKVNFELTQKVFKFMSNDLILLDDTSYYQYALDIMNSFYSVTRVPFFDCVYMALTEDYGINKMLSLDSHFDLNKNIKMIF